MASDERCIRLFLSADLVGSTAYKQRRETDVGKYRAGPPWADLFQEFYTGFPTVFQNLHGTVKLAEQLRAKLVKALGDELLFQTQITKSTDACEVITHFRAALYDWSSKNLSDLGLSLKGTAWIAGFPINNHQVTLPVDERRRSAEDFIGPSVDAGFRLTAFSSPSRLVLAVDLALLLVSNDGRELPIFFDGTHVLKGVLGGKPYPVLWTNVQTGDDLARRELTLADRRACNNQHLRDYCETFVKSCTDSWLVRPYFRQEDDPQFCEIPEWHKSVYEVRRETDSKLLADESPVTVRVTGRAPEVPVSVSASSPEES